MLNQGSPDRAPSPHATESGEAPGAGDAESHPDEGQAIDRTPPRRAGLERAHKSVGPHGTAPAGAPRSGSA